MSISEARVAEITTWGNSCALSSTAIFLVDAFLNQKLSSKAEDSLKDIFNGHYNTDLTVDELRDFFSEVIDHPSDRQMVLGPVLRGFIYSEGVRPEEGDMLSNEAFEPLAREFGFNVEFYADVEHEIDVSGTIPSIEIDPDFNLIMRIYYHKSHYDLIMDSKELARTHCLSGFDSSRHDLTIEAYKKEEFKERIKGLAETRYGVKADVDLVGEQQQFFDDQIKVLLQQATELQKTDPEQAKKRIELIGELQNRTEDFFAPDRIIINEQLLDFTRIFFDQVEKINALNISLKTEDREEGVLQDEDISQDFEKLVDDIFELAVDEDYKLDHEDMEMLAILASNLRVLNHKFFEDNYPDDINEFGDNFNKEIVRAISKLKPGFFDYIRGKASKKNHVVAHLNNTIEKSKKLLEGNHCSRGINL